MTASAQTPGQPPKGPAGPDYLSRSFSAPNANAADVSVQVIREPTGPIFVNDTLRYRIVVANAGPAQARRIELDIVSRNLGSMTAPGACTTVNAIVKCFIESLNAGGSADIFVSAPVVGAGLFGLSASAHMLDEFDPQAENNLARDVGNAAQRETPPGNVADMTVRITRDTKGPVHVNDVVHYTIAVGNLGPDTARRIGLQLNPWNLGSPEVTGACAALSCLIDSQPAGTGWVAFLTSRVMSSGDFGLIAQVHALGVDPQSGNNVARDVASTAPDGSVDVSVQVSTDHKGPFHVGDAVPLRVDVRNGGPSTATGVLVALDAKNLALTAADGACSLPRCAIRDLAPGDGDAVNLTARIQAEGEFGLAARVGAKQTDRNPDNNTSAMTQHALPSPAAATTSPPTREVPPPGCEGCADLSVTERLNTPAPFLAGQRVSYSVTIRNNGPSPAPRVQIDDQPENLSLVDGPGAMGGLPYEIESLAAGEQQTFTVVATIRDKGAFSNVVIVGSKPKDPIARNNTTPALGGTATSSPLGGLGLGLGLAVVAGLGALVVRGRIVRARWAGSLRVVPSLDRAGKVSVSPIPEVCPALTLQSHVEPGAAAPVGPVEVLREIRDV